MPFPLHRHFASEYSNSGLDAQRRVRPDHPISRGLPMNRCHAAGLRGAHAVSPCLRLAAFLLLAGAGCGGGGGGEETDDRKAAASLGVTYTPGWTLETLKEPRNFEGHTGPVDHIQAVPKKTLTKYECC